ncbi:MAG: CHAD domain-containing protein [Albidovulum sp.]
MAFRFNHDDLTAHDGLRRLATERARRALAVLDNPDLTISEQVFATRKHIKKLRALLRLIRPNFKGYRQENEDLRGTAQLIADLRDHDAINEALVNLAALTGLKDTVLVQLSATRPLAESTTQTATGRLSTCKTSLKAFLGRCAEWDIAGEDFGCLQPGLERSWRRAQKAAQAARTTPEVEPIHIWRKRVKDHWYHARLLAPVWPQMMGPHVAVADQLGKLLGEARDLHLLRLWLESCPETPASVALGAVAHRREPALLAQAHDLSDRLFTDQAACLSARWGKWWKDWRSQPPHANQPQTNSPASARPISATVSSTP